MKYDKSVTIGFANLNPIFMKFQEQHKNICQRIAENKRSEIVKSFKIVSSFYFEYRTYVISSELRIELDKYINKLKNELYEDDIYAKLCQTKKKSPSEKIEYNRLYYKYLIKILKMIGMLVDEFSKTIMPNKTDRSKLIGYSNNNAFFDQFTYYKSLTANILSNFKMNNFKECFSYLICFYFAYYLFIDEKSRHLCEDTFSKILSLYLSKEILKLVVFDYNKLGEESKKQFREMDFIIHDALNHIFYRCNYSYSEYNIMPKIQKRILIDRTAI